MSNDAAAITEQAVDPLKSVAAAMAKAAESVREKIASADADGEAKAEVPVGDPFVSRFAYSSSYVVSYAVVFPTLYLATVIPGGRPIAMGISDGARAASTSVREMKAKRAGKMRSEAERESRVGLARPQV
jgi:hypothetical protein